KKSGISGSSDSMLIYGMDVNGNNYLVLHIFETKTDGNLIPELSESSSGEIAGLIGPSGGFPPPPKIFKLNKNGTGFTILKTLSLTGGDGYIPKHGLVLYNGYFYGVNTNGGNGGQANGSIFRIKEDGSNFSVVKYFNTGSSDGSGPEGGLTLGSDNKLYGVTQNGGLNHIGTVFSLNPSNLTFQVIYNFGFSDGFVSLGKFTEANDGKLYTIRIWGIFGINRDGSNPVFISTPNYTARQNENGLTYLTEIPLPVTTELCAPIASTILKSDINGINYQWQLNTGTGFVSITDNSNYVATNTDSLKLNNIPSSWNGYQYRCLADGGASKTYTLQFINSWTGTLNNSWEIAGNWSCGSIPDSNTDVVINSGTVVVNSNVTIRSLKVDAGVNITVKVGFNFLITH
ncbi:MAG: choice-of-anchor tandem repeat GloVer-containing protein, partial [Ginsengibacter sp.]